MRLLESVLPTPVERMGYLRLMISLVISLHNVYDSPAGHIRHLALQTLLPRPGAGSSLRSQTNRPDGSLAATRARRNAEARRSLSILPRTAADGWGGGEANRQ